MNAEKQALIDHFDGVEVAGVPLDGVSPDFTGTSPGPFEITSSTLKAYVWEKLKGSARQTHTLLTTVLTLGMQKTVVTDGRVMTKLTFHVDATDSATSVSHNVESKASSWGISGRLSFAKKAFGLSIAGGASSSKLMVSVVNERSNRAINVTADIIGQVDINFRTETFPTPPAAS